MTSCLYECLYEVGLQQYYPQFAALGLRRLSHLSQLTMEDYPRLGVQDMMDRTRLFHLVQLVKGIEDEDDSDEKEDRGASTEAVCPYRKPPPCRQLDFSAHSTKLTQATRNPCADYTHTPSCRPQTDRETPIRNVHTNRETQRQSSHTPTGTPKRSARIDKKTHRCHIDKVKSRNSKTREEKGLADPSPRKSRLQQEVAQVYRVKRTPSYSYGLPMSSSAFSTRELTGQASVSAAERIRVCVRKRPLSRSEERRGETDVVTAGDRDRVLVHEQKEAVDLTQYVLQHEFYFDEVFSEACTNEDIYKKTAWPLIQHIFNGGKATCFAYGQTGAGKTHTMLGSSPRRPGLYALAAHDIFARLAQPKAGSGSGLVCSLGPIYVCVSFFEIYCGQLYDLLDHRKRLFAREDGQGVVQISGLREVEVQSVAALLEVISWGSRGRSRGMSGVNCDSSRSHALVQIHLRDRMQQLVGRSCWFQSFIDSLDSGILICHC
ncbi:hypothetical protein AGOR_G00050160 [Albula goreensis]|uniref:Uncharacterized protein n=1 Tax=Albula goreensis TaxID=1534307 RepID=A0A8T3DVS3_9TELE|nr:hypothetical protein AGOR_G00050160 [Albula goreensis]